jgi:ribosomal protein S18 acetylase RimI-like enzyme
VFEEYAESEQERLGRVIQRTYEGTLDCTALDGIRDMDDVIDGYKATGTFRPVNWMFVRHEGADIGVLLLADHVAARHWELMYMGIVPEYRGRGWGRQIAHYAQWLARGARAERLLVAVDAKNRPAANVYRSTGFEIWELRAVYVRTRAT